MAETALKPSPEQECAVAHFSTGGDIKVRAVAGSGKTTTLRMMAQTTPHKRMLYLAFNRSVKEEAERKFPPNVEVKTLHGLAYGEVVRGHIQYESKLRAGNGQVRPLHVSEALGVKWPNLALVIRDTLERFIRSGMEKPIPAHIPVEYPAQRLMRISQEKWVEEEGFILRGVERLWERMRNPKDSFPLSHDGYVRIWAERGARLTRWDVVLVDEAQDLDPLFLNILEGGRGQVQRVYVGDPRQQIYSWRGAVNAMGQLDAPEAPLTWSFRFADHLAALVRNLTALPHVDRPIEITGRAEWDTTIGPDIPKLPFTVLTRTNIGTIRAIMQLVDTHRDCVHVVGGVEELAWLLEDAGDLVEGVERKKPHPELAGVSNYDELWELAEASAQIKMLVELVEGHDPYGLAAYLRRIQSRDEQRALVVFSTAHKAKGREWDKTLIWDDYFPWWVDVPGRVWEPEEENLFYVALTRAKKQLSLLKLPSLMAYVENAPAASPKPNEPPWTSRALDFLGKVALDQRLPEDIRNQASQLIAESPDI